MTILDEMIWKVSVFVGAVIAPSDLVECQVCKGRLELANGYKETA